MDAGKVAPKQQVAHPTKARSQRHAGPRESVSLGNGNPMARVDKLIAAFRSGKIHYAPEIEAGIRKDELTAANFPCQKYVIHAGRQPLFAGDMATQIVAKDERPRYKHSVTMDSKLTHKQNEKDLESRVKSIHKNSNELYAQHGEALMVLLEGDNADGKDGMIKHVFGVNPQTTSGSHAFKAANAEERQHEPNWRIMQHLPGAGQIGFHNRTGYGDVVFAAQTPAEKRARQADLKEMEFGLTMGLPMTDEGHIAMPDAKGKVDPGAVQRPPMRFLKVLLNTSKPEQAARLAERLLNEKKLYKESQADIDGHDAHLQVQSGYANAMAPDSTPWAPAYLIPNDDKTTGWRKLAQITDKILNDMDPHRPGYQGDLTPAQRKAAAQPLQAEVEAALKKKHHHA